jgi:hypothetical protein
MKCSLLWIGMIVKVANEALCDLLEPVLLVLIVSLGKKDYKIVISPYHCLSYLESLPCVYKSIPFTVRSTLSLGVIYLDVLLLVLIVSLGKKDYILHYSTVHS